MFSRNDVRRFIDEGDEDIDNLHDLDDLYNDDQTDFQLQPGSYISCLCLMCVLLYIFQTYTYYYSKFDMCAFTYNISNLYLLLLIL